MFLSIIICAIGTTLMVGRLYWVLARDNATPFSGFFSQVNEKLSCPVPATILCATLCTAFGAIQLGSQTAFLDLGTYYQASLCIYLRSLLIEVQSGAS